MTRVFSLNLNHRTQPRVVRQDLVDAISALRPDILVFNEYVNQGPAIALPGMLSDCGFPHAALSDSVEYAPRRWHNQILIASTEPILKSKVLPGGPDEMCRTNALSAFTHGLGLTGLRVPAYKNAGDWYRYWGWMNLSLIGDIAIGDFNADSSRKRKWDRVLEILIEKGGWTRADIAGDWSYKGNNGSTSKVDHLLTRGRVAVENVQYLYEPFVPGHTDHAAILADVSVGK